jgi:flavin-dependent dehydrogenase
VTDGESPARAARREEVWQRCLATAPLTRERLLGLAATSAPVAYLAAPGLLAWDVRKPLLPVGDALLSFDPISADGLCFALRSGLEAADALTGRRGSLDAYRTGANAIFRAHLARRELVYASERTHRKSAFWQRARAPVC